MWARGLAGWAGELGCTQVALGCFDDREPCGGVYIERSARLADLDHADGLIRAAVRAGRAADAGAVVDADGAGVEVAGDGSGGAADHADGIDAVHTRIGDHQVIVCRALANEARVVVVRCCTGPHAIIAARAPIEIDQHRLGAVEEPMVGEEIEEGGIDFGFRISDCGLKGRGALGFAPWLRGFRVRYDQSLYYLRWDSEHVDVSDRAE